MPGYLSADIRSVPRSEQISESGPRGRLRTLKDKYPSIFSHHTEAVVFIVRQIFFATHVVLKTDWGI